MICVFVASPGVITFEGAFCPSPTITILVLPSSITCELTLLEEVTGVIICEGAPKATILPETKPKAKPTETTTFLMFDKRMNDISFFINFISLALI